MTEVELLRARVAELEAQSNEALANGIAEACRIFKASFRPPKDLDALTEKLAENRPAVKVAQLLECTTGNALAVVHEIRESATQELRAQNAALVEALECIKHLTSHAHTGVSAFKAVEGVRAQARAALALDKGEGKS